MTQVNLLPTTVKQKQTTRRATSLSMFAVIAILVLLIGVYFLESNRLASAKSDLAAQQQKNAQLQTQINGLQRYQNLADAQVAKAKLVGAIKEQVVPWSAILHDISSVIPNDVYLTSVNGSVTLTSGGVTPATSTAGLIGTLQIQGNATSDPAVAQWLTRVSVVRGWANPWVTTATTQPSGEVQFSGSIDLSPMATTHGGRR